jgi:hypothetical protein
LLREALEGEMRLLQAASRLVAQGHADPTTMKQRVSKVMQLRTSVADIRKRLAAGTPPS